MCFSEIPRPVLTCIGTGLCRSWHWIELLSMLYWVHWKILSEPKKMAKVGALGLDFWGSTLGRFWGVDFGMLSKWKGVRYSL